MELLKIEQVDNGYKLILNGEVYYSPEFTNEGIYYKDSEAYRNGGVCYIREFAFDDSKAIEINGSLFYNEDDFEKSDLITRKDILKLVKYNEDLADIVFEMSEWASIEATYDNLNFEDSEKEE